MNSRTISDDDLCSDCARCVYQPGEQSQCARDFPAQADSDGYITACPEFLQQDYTGQNVPAFIWLRQFQPTTPGATAP